MVLLHPGLILIFGNFPPNLFFLLLTFEKFQPAWSYYIHPARLLDSLEYQVRLYFTFSFMKIAYNEGFSVLFLSKIMFFFQLYLIVIWFHLHVTHLH